MLRSSSIKFNEDAGTNLVYQRFEIALRTAEMLLRSPTEPIRSFAQLTRTIESPVEKTLE